MRWHLVLLGPVLLAGCVAKTTQPGPAPERVVSEPVTYPAGKERGMGALYRPTAARASLIVVHNDSGITPAIKDNARRLAEKGYLVLAVDLYRGVQVKRDVEDAHIMDRAMPEEQVLGDLRAAVTFLATQKDGRPERIGILGWGSGGGYALDVAVADERVRAVVTCYGRLRTAPEGLRGLKAPVLGIFAGKDEGITKETIEQFKAAMGKAGKRVAGTFTYAGSDHGFLEREGESAGGPPGAVVDAWMRIEGFLEAELAGGP